MDIRDFGRSTNIEDRRGMLPPPMLASEVLPDLFRHALLAQVQRGMPPAMPSPLAFRAGAGDAGMMHYAVPLDTLLSPYLLRALLAGGGR